MSFKLNCITYELRDVSIKPSVCTKINHRIDVNINVDVCGRECLPIFVSPMGDVTDETNYKTWIDNKLTPVVPRTISRRLSFEDRMKIAEQTFVSISKDEAFEMLNEKFDQGRKTRYICIDIANGHMYNLIEICKRLKHTWGDKLIIMTGNIANAETYVEYCKAKIDYVRVGIGGGSRCTTSANVAIHTGMATLLDDILEIKRTRGYTYTKVIADGGLYNSDDMIKAFALGADFVMLGRVFAECEEACGKVYYSFNKKSFENGLRFETYSVANTKPFRDYSGMSTRLMQIETGGKGDKTAEGITRAVEVKYPVVKWLDNFCHNLRSALSYCDSIYLSEFRYNANVNILGGSGDLAYRK